MRSQLNFERSYFPNKKKSNKLTFTLSLCLRVIQLERKDGGAVSQRDKDENLDQGVIDGFG